MPKSTEFLVLPQNCNAYPSIRPHWLPRCEWASEPAFSDV